MFLYFLFIHLLVQKPVRTDNKGFMSPLHSLEGTSNLLGSAFWVGHVADLPTSVWSWGISQFSWYKQDNCLLRQRVYRHTPWMELWGPKILLHFIEQLLKNLRTH